MLAGTGSAVADLGRLVVVVPADAKLVINDVVSDNPSGVRTIESQDLEPGQDYYYDLEATVVRNGQTMTERKRVTVTAGVQTKATFYFPAEQAQPAQTYNPGTTYQQPQAYNPGTTYQQPQSYVPQNNGYVQQPQTFYPSNNGYVQPSYPQNQRLVYPQGNGFQPGNQFNPPQNNRFPNGGPQLNAGIDGTQGNNSLPQRYEGKNSPKPNQYSPNDLRRDINNLQQLFNPRSAPQRVPGRR